MLDKAINMRLIKYINLIILDRSMRLLNNAV